MDVRWAELKEEARALAKESGVSGRAHHSLARGSVSLQASVRARGIPAEHREWVWPILLHTHKQALQRQSSNFATYAQLLAGLDDNAEAEASLETTTTTTTSEPSGLQQARESAMERFSHLNPFQERKIKRILLAYTKSKDEFYYCHGMVEICAVLSTFLSEDDAFWAFRLLLEQLLPKYHEQSIIDFQVDCLVLEEVLARQDTVLAEHFSTMGVTVQVLCSKWFFSFFAESMPFELVCRLYDILLVDISARRPLSAKILFSTSAAVLLYLSEMLREIQDPSVLVDLIGEFCATTLSEYSVAETFVDLVLFLHEQLQDDELMTLRRKYRDQLEREQRERNSLTGMADQAATAEALTRSASATKQLRKGKSQSIKLIIQWTKDEETETEDTGEEIQLELVATPTEKEVLVKLHEGIDKINRRRSRTSSLRNIDLLLGRSSMTGSFLTSPREMDVESDDDDDHSNVSLTGSMERPLHCATTQPPPAPPLELAWETLRSMGNHAAVVQRSLRGIPDEHRAWVWPILLAQAPTPKSLPRSFPPITNDEDDLELEPDVLKAIENDISRTRNLEPSQFAPMRRVLRAFAVRNRRVGYCQGMNEILAVLLQYLTEHDALLGLLLLLDSVLPSYHVDSMIGLHTDCAVMNTLLRQNDAALHAHLQQMGLNMEILCTKWLVTCYLTTLPPFCGLTVMDMLLARVTEPKKTGSRVLLGVGLALFFSMRNALLAAKDAGEVLMAINEYFASEQLKSQVEWEAFLEFCHHVIDQLVPDVVDEFRLVHKDEVLERFALFEAKKIEMRQQLELAKQAARLGQGSGGGGGYNSGGSDCTPPPGGNAIRPQSSPPSAWIDGTSGRKSSGFSSIIKPSGVLRSRHTTVGEEGYQRVGSSTTGGGLTVGIAHLDVHEVNRSFADDLAQMEEQIDDAAEMFARGKIDEREHACIKAQIVRKWCKGLNSPQTAMLRVQQLKLAYGKGEVGASRRVMGGGRALTDPNGRNGGGAIEAVRKKSSGVSLYGRMKKVKKSAIAIFKATFE